MEPLEYRAFISYRHLSPDQEIAKKLHTLIETYGIPVSLRRSLGITKMGRVFRDQEELPLSSDLGDDIHQALDHSEWLICICSPRYPESTWCLEEVRYFQSIWKGDHILTILAEGEPETAFPEALRFKEIDGRTVEAEPLAADVRAATLAESLKKLDAEKLRILAPMLGVNFDDLRQRARKRRNRILAAVIAGAFAVLSGFLGYAVVKNAQVTGQRNAALISQSRFLADAANDLVERNGDRLLAVQLACEALPENFEKPERPVTDEALYALRTALVSGLTDRYVAFTDLDFPVSSYQMTYNDTLLVHSSGVPGYVAAYSLSNGERKDYAWSLDRSPVRVVFPNAYIGFLFACYDGFYHAEEVYHAESGIYGPVIRTVAPPV